MEIKELKAKVIEEIQNVDSADILEEVLFILDKKNNHPYIDILKWKGKIFSENDNLLKRLS